eukprot:CAMPEP_0174888984 /NCGR_PEP_ID=MMETSP0167-20121228/4256_1 /TAXON_ID=38298 /ORGANISM="Rhodella maculata, Strain CCMP736" /LENGTH=49 /DNA_ID= /DNA_START= /DNA_END= /DNA_ORIENTATION=
MVAEELVQAAKRLRQIHALWIRISASAVTVPTEVEDLVQRRVRQRREAA